MTSAVADTPAAPPASATRAAACPLCEAPLREGQEWCLRCGAAARTRLAASPSWRAPLVSAAAVAVLSLGVIAASLVRLAASSDEGRPPLTTTITTGTAPAAAPPAATTPTTPTTSAPPSTSVPPSATTTVPTTTVPKAGVPGAGAVPRTLIPGVRGLGTGSRGGGAVNGLPPRLAKRLAELRRLQTEARK